MLRPISLLLNKLTDSITRRFANGHTYVYQFSKEQFKTTLPIVGHEGPLNEIETSTLHSDTNFETLTVKDIDASP
ncbi:hypothetical protein FE74_15345 [Staphylococcus aureus]|nr:hypothetical protein FE74_15345 [Staphylococcus aureus]